MKEDFAVRRERRPWSACPNCSVDLRPKGLERKPQYLGECPFCGVPIVPIWWQRLAVAVFALVLTFAIPGYLGLVGATLFFAGILCFFPTLLLTQILVITTIPPKYVRKGQTVTTLFQR
jgi:hypothetical protein